MEWCCIGACDERLLRHARVTGGTLSLDLLGFTQEKRSGDDSHQVQHESASAHLAGICLAILALLDACSFDEGKLRRHARGDAATATDVAASPDDTARTGGDDLAVREAGADALADLPDGFRDVSGSDLTDGAAAGGGDGGLGDTGGSGLGDSATDRLPGSEEDGPMVPVDTAGLYDGGAAHELGEDFADAPSTEDTGPDDRGAQTIDAPAGADVENAALDANDSQARSDARDDAPSVDARGKKTCPTTISGSLDRSDSTQIGRLSRVDSASACGTTKEFPGNGADRTYSHLYDIHHFINVASTPVCFTFALTYASPQELYLAAYSSFDPTEIAFGYLGDVGDTLTPPQTMGITVGPAETIDVVVYAVAIGTAPAGAYTLGCSAQ
jgi:hypothetical protein